MAEQHERENTDESGFQALGLVEGLASAVAKLGYEEPTPIQREVIPLLLKGHDVLAQAATGTGKTAAFALPMIQRIGEAPAADEPPRGLVLVPTRELAMQMAEAFHRYGKSVGLAVVPVFGGAPIEQQIRALERGASVVVATPGRALDHIRRSTLDLSGIKMLVLDEADEMLDLGFAEDLDAILGATAKGRQTALFSATIPARIAAIAARHLKSPKRVTIAREVSAGKIPKIRQIAYIVARAQKSSALNRILESESPSSAIVFCRTRLEVDALGEELTAHGYRAAVLHGGLAQRQRDKVMKAFRAGNADILIATDVAARGLDISHLSHVVNYDVPSAPEDYLHRIGRTGRAERTGTAITLAEPREHRHLRGIEAFTKQKIEVRPLPTASDIRARRFEVLQATIRERLLAGKLDEARVIVETLASESDIVDVASAAVELLLSASASEKARPGEEGMAAAPGGAETSGAGVARIYIGAGKKDGVRPGDLVGAITGEADVDSRELGAIRITERFAIVEVPARLSEEIIEALSKSGIRGRRVRVREDRDHPAPKDGLPARDDGPIRRGARGPSGRR